MASWWDSDWNPATWARKIGDAFSGLGGSAPTSGIKAPSARITAPAIRTTTDLTQLKQQRAQANAPTPEEAMRAKLDQLKAMLVNQPGMSQSQMRSGAMSAASAQYGPQMDFINQLMDRARDTTKRQQGVTRDTYADLAAMYGSDRKSARAESKRNAEGENDRLAQLKDEIKGDYTDSMDYLRDTMSQLGIQAAAPDVLPELAADEATSLRQGTQESNAWQQAEASRGAATDDYLRKGGIVSKLAGAEQSDKLGMQLQDYLFQQQGQLAQLQAQQQNAYTAAMGDYQKQQQQQQNDTWSKLLQIYGLEKGLMPKKSDPVKVGKGLLGASQYLSQHFKGTQWEKTEPSRYAGLLQDLIIQIGGSGNTLTPEQMITKADEYARRLGVSPSALSRAMAAYVGKF